MKLRIPFFGLVALLFSSMAFAQIRQGTVEISPFAGYLFGGEFARGTTALFDTDVDVADRATYGIRLGYNINSKFEVELQGSRTQTEFETRGSSTGLFGNSTTQKLGNLDIDYYLANMVFNFGHGRAVPYITIGGGAARLSPSVPNMSAQREYRGTATLGAGVKVFLTPMFGLRFDGRYYATAIHDDDTSDCHFNDCRDRHDWLSNGDVTGGIVFAF